MVKSLWLTDAQLITPHTISQGAVCIENGRIAAIARRAPKSAKSISLRGAYLAPGFVDLHVWGDPQRISREAVKSGTTAFLTTLGPEPQKELLRHITQRSEMPMSSAVCLGFHLEGPFLNPRRAGALPARHMRRPSVGELNALHQAGRIRLVTMAPELAGTSQAIAWCQRHRIVASLGHSMADAKVSTRAMDAGAKAITHVFNGMRPLHHRKSSLVDVALTDARLTTMVILDGVHVSPSAFRLLVRAKGPKRIALVTDSIRHQGWPVIKRRGAFYLRDGTLAGSDLTMMEAVKHAVQFAGLSVTEAVRMATEVPARLLADRSRGMLARGRRADLVVFDQRFRVRLTMVGGRVVYHN